MNEDNLKQIYNDNLKTLEHKCKEVQGSLENVVKILYQRRKFKASVPPARVKTIAMIIDKMKRKAIDVDNLFINKADGKISMVVNDIIAARIICNTKDDVTDIINIIKENNRFTIIKEQKYDKKPNGYRAYHIDAEYETHWDDNLVYITVEIQIKTQFQNAWAEVTHDESYKPSDGLPTGEIDRQYTLHIADILDTLDDMACTIRKTRLAFVNPTETVHDEDTAINIRTLSNKIYNTKNKEQLTQQELELCLERFKELEFGNIAEIVELLESREIYLQIKKYKEQKLGNFDSVTTFELLYYGSLLFKGLESGFEKEMQVDYSLTEYECEKCGKYLSKDEFDLICNETDSDCTEMYCAEHIDEGYPNKCLKCGIRTNKELCKNCEAEIERL